MIRLTPFLVIMVFPCLLSRPVSAQAQGNQGGTKGLPAQGSQGGTKGLPGPDNRLVSGDFTRTPVDSFVLVLERQTGVQFYYDSTQLDSLTITLSVRDQPLGKVLEMAFEHTDFFYAIDGDGDVFLTRGFALDTGQPSSFLPGDSLKGRTGMSRLPKRFPSEVRVEQGMADTSVEGEVTSLQETILQNRLMEIGDRAARGAGGRATVAGYIRDAKTGEPIVGASVYIDHPGVGIASDQYGYYSISVAKGRHVLYVQSIGMKDTRRQILLNSDGRLNVDLNTRILALKNVVISSEKVSNIRGLEMGVQRLDIKSIKQVPSVFGEPDVLKVVLTLPGVKSVGESSTGLNVRGGSTDQNLILFNDMTIYNPSHFFGLFSAFNPEVVKDVELYKSSIPAKYGGRLSSVLDVTAKEGNKKQITGSAGIGVLTSRINLEGPIVNEKTSFIFGARATYADWLLNLLPAQYKNSKASFYDLDLGITHTFNNHNSLYLTAYLSQDRFNLNSDTTYSYGNRNVSLKWKHTFNNKLNMDVITGYDRYQYSISSNNNPVTASDLTFNVNQTNLKANFTYYLSPKHTLQFGASSIYYKLHPGTYTPVGAQSLTAADTLQPEQALESAVFLSDEYKISSAFSVEGGIRYSMFNYLGPSVVNDYAPGLPVTVPDMTGTTDYAKGKFIKTYGGPEYRISARYSLSENLSVKASYNTERQYIHMLSNTTAMAPTDIWKLTDTHILPTTGDMYSLGAYRNFKNNTIETSVEVYYRNIYNYLDYKDGAVLVMNSHIETDVLNTRGKAYGVEFMIRKQTGKLNGWFSYTYSRTLLRMNDPLAGEVVNGGNYYPASYDEPHDLNLIGNYRVNHRFSVSLNTLYNTGRPITLPIGVYYYDGSERALYSDRNQYRIPNYFRTDLSMNIEGNHKVHQKTHNSFTIGVYNLTGRQNPYSVYYVSQNGVVNGYQLSIFGSAIPYINYNIRF
jgi:hypothetical protein